MPGSATTSFSEARRNLTAIADRVANEGVEYTVFKRSKPLFKMVPVRDKGEEGQGNASADEQAPAYGVRSWTRATAAVQAQEHALASGVRRAAEDGGILPGEKATSCVRHSPIPDGGEEVLEFATQLRARMPRNTELSHMTPQDVKTELERRDE